MSEEVTLLDFLDEIKNTAYERMGLNETDSESFNFATISKTEAGIDYIEYWLLINAYYDESIERFVKIDGTATSFGIQLQGKGTYPGEQSLGYTNNTGINIWRNPRKSEVYKDTTNYDYTDFDNNNHIGAKKRSNNEWVEFAIGSGWTNNLMTDSYGGVTIGGAGIEIDGNNIFPYSRVTSSKYNDGTNNYYLLGILENAYHPTSTGWDCDNNTKQAWFFGFKYPETAGAKDGENGKFIVMYNDMNHIDPTANGYTLEDMNVNDWHVILEVGKTSTKAIVDGVLTVLGAGGGGSYDDTDLKEKMGYDNIPEGESLQGQITDLDDNKANMVHSHTISDLPTANAITDGDTTHIASVDVIYDYIEEIIGDADDWLTS